MNDKIFYSKLQQSQFNHISDMPHLGEHGLDEAQVGFNIAKDGVVQARIGALDPLLQLRVVQENEAHRPGFVLNAAAASTLAGVQVIDCANCVLSVPVDLASSKAERSGNVGDFDLLPAFETGKFVVPHVLFVRLHGAVCEDLARHDCGAAFLWIHKLSDVD